MRKLLNVAVALAGLALVSTQALAMPNNDYTLTVVTKVGVSRTFGGAGQITQFTPFPNDANLGNEATYFSVDLSTPTGNCSMNIATTSPIETGVNLDGGFIPIQFDSVSGSSCPPQFTTGMLGYMSFTSGNVDWTPADGVACNVGPVPSFKGEIVNNNNGQPGSTVLATLSFICRD